MLSLDPTFPLSTTPEAKECENCEATATSPWYQYDADSQTMTRQNQLKKRPVRPQARSPHPGTAVPTPCRISVLTL